MHQQRLIKNQITPRINMSFQLLQVNRDNINNLNQLVFKLQQINSVQFEQDIVLQNYPNIWQLFQFQLQDDQKNEQQKQHHQKSNNGKKKNVTQLNEVSTIINNIQSLIIQNNSLATISLLQLNKLQILILNNNNLKEIDLSKLEHLIYLDISFNQFTQLDMSFSKNIQFLKANNNALNKIKLCNQQLVYLDLSCNNLELQQIFNQLKSNPAINLQYCNLCGNHIGQQHIIPSQLQKIKFLLISDKDFYQNQQEIVQNQNPTNLNKSQNQLKLSNADASVITDYLSQSQLSESENISIVEQKQFNQQQEYSFEINLVHDLTFSSNFIQLLLKLEAQLKEANQGQTSVDPLQQNQLQYKQIAYINQLQNDISQKYVMIEQILAEKQKLYDVQIKQNQVNKQQSLHSIIAQTHKKLKIKQNLLYKLLFTYKILHSRNLLYIQQNKEKFLFETSYLGKQQFKKQKRQNIRQHKSLKSNYNNLYIDVCKQDKSPAQEQYHAALEEFSISDHSPLQISKSQSFTYQRSVRLQIEVNNVNEEIEVNINDDGITKKSSYQLMKQILGSSGQHKSNIQLAQGNVLSVQALSQQNGVETNKNDGQFVQELIVK